MNADATDAGVAGVAGVERYVRVARTYASEGRPLRAIATCKLILQIEPAHAATLAMLSDLYAKRDSAAPVAVPDASDEAELRGVARAPGVDPGALVRIPLFSELPPAAFISLAREFRRREVRSGEVVIEEGSVGDALFAIAHGRLQVERRNGGSPTQVVAEMSDGEFFGEISFVSRCPRLSTVTALTDSELLELGRKELDALLAKHPPIGGALMRFHRERLLENVLRASPILRLLPPSTHAAFTALLRVETYPARRVLLERAQPSAGFFLLLRGECEVFHTSRDGREKPYPSMHEGDVFGEISLLQGTPATATVRTTVPCVVLRLPREAFDELLLAHPPVREALYQLASQRLDRTRTLLVKELFDKALV